MGFKDTALDIGAGALSEGTGGVLGEVFGKRAEGRQMNNQRHLMDLAKKNQMELNKQGNELSMDLWNRTNYGAQMKHLKEAGLNPALMYKQGGASGTTSGQSGGSAQGGNVAQGANMMDIGQYKLMEAQTRKIDAETRNLDERSETESELRWFNKTLLDSKSKLTLAQQSEAMESATLLNERAKRMNYENNAIAKNRDLYNRSQWAKMNQEIIKKEADDLNIELTEEKMKQVQHKIWQDWVNAGSGVLASAGFVIKALKGFGHNPKETFTQYPDGGSKTTTY